MDGSPQVVRFDATTLWHFDAAEWAPSTASKAEILDLSIRCPLRPESGHRPTRLACPLSANRVLARRSKDDFAHGVVMRVTVMRNGMGAGRQKSYNCMVPSRKTINMTWRWS